jgi:hypothetical protein
LYRAAGESFESCMSVSDVTWNLPKKPVVYLGREAE